VHKTLHAQQQVVEVNASVHHYRINRQHDSLTVFHNRHEKGVDNGEVDGGNVTLINKQQSTTHFQNRGPTLWDQQQHNNNNNANTASTRVMGSA
jgi:hypothetical protein